MKITKDKKLNIGYVQFRKGSAAKTLKLRKDLLVDINSKGQVLGIEVLSLSETAPALKTAKKTRRTKQTSRKRAA